MWREIERAELQMASNLKTGTGIYGPQGKLVRNIMRGIWGLNMPADGPCTLRRVVRQLVSGG